MKLIRLGTRTLNASGMMELYATNLRLEGGDFASLRIIMDNGADYQLATGDADEVAELRSIVEEFMTGDPDMGDLLDVTEALSLIRHRMEAA